MLCPVWVIYLDKLIQTGTCNEDGKNEMAYLTYKKRSTETNLFQYQKYTGNDI